MKAAPALELRKRTTPKHDSKPADAVNEVLVVEDSTVERHRMEAMLRRLGYTVTVATDGQHAMQILRERPIQLVLSDWRMPHLSGIDLCRTLRADPSLGQPYVILVTGRNAPVDLIAGMDAGADDFISKPVNAEELRVRLQAGARLVTMREVIERRNAELEAASEREAAASVALHRDLTLAASLQVASLPRGPSPFAELEIATLFRAAAHVAGDGYGYFPLDDRHLAFFVIDVAGHGVASAMLSFAVSRFLIPDSGAIALSRDGAGTQCEPGRQLPSSIVAPERVVHALNRHFVDDDECGLFFTMIYGVIDVQTGRGELCQAGHPHPLIVGAGSVNERVGNGGFPVGMIADARFERVPFALERGQRLYLHSDGLTDCTGRSGEAFGSERLGTLLARVTDTPCGRGVARIERELHSWRGGRDAEDDMSMLVIERVAEAAPKGTPR